MSDAPVAVTPPAGPRMAPVAAQDFSRLRLLFPVATHKFIVMNLCTLTLYTLYWSYQQWRRINEHENGGISPFWRAFFMLLWVIPLLNHVKDDATARVVPARWSPTLLGVLFIVMEVSARLPGDVWLVPAMLSFLTLVPAVRTCHNLNALSAHPEGLNARYSGWNILIIVVGGLFWMLVLIGILLPEQP